MPRTVADEADEADKLAALVTGNHRHRRAHPRPQAQAGNRGARPSERLADRVSKRPPRVTPWLAKGARGHAHPHIGIVTGDFGNSIM